MLRLRIIPVLLLTESGAVKTERFKTRRYVGDPINALRVFNEKEVDEIFILDIEATAAGCGPDFNRARDLASECFMPMGYGGGIRSVADAEKLFAVGVEKVVLGTIAAENPQIVREIASRAGSQSVVVCVDVKRDWLGRLRVCARSGRRNTGLDPVAFAQRMAELGAGEILVQSVDRDGTRQGYDLDLVRSVAANVRVPVVACGGAGSLADFQKAFQTGASAAAAGSQFVFYGRHHAVLITYPTQDELRTLQSPNS
jgi:cyclase